MIGHSAVPRINTEPDEKTIASHALTVEEVIQSVHSLKLSLEKLLREPDAEILLPVSQAQSTLDQLAILDNKLDKHQQTESHDRIRKSLHKQPKQVKLKDVKLHLPWLPKASEDGRGIRWKVFVLLDDPSASQCGHSISVLIMFLIVVSTTSFLLESMPQFKSRPAECAERIRLGHVLTTEACEPRALPIFGWIETVCMIVFTIEYLGRVLCVHVMPLGSQVHDGSSIAVHTRFFSGLKGSGLHRTWQYAQQPMNVVDFAAIFPFYLELVLGSGAGGLAVLRVLRLSRVFRIFKLGKYNAGLFLFVEVMAKSAPAMKLTMFFYLIITVLLGSLIFFCEFADYSIAADWISTQCNGTNMDTIPGCLADLVPGTGAFIRPSVDGHSMTTSPFESIPLSFWWVCTTTTTVGYGDFYPTTTAGKAVGMMSFYIGIIFLAMPISILGLNFSAGYHAQRKLLAEAKEKLQAKARRTSTTIEKFDNIAGLLMADDVDDEDPDSEVAIARKVARAARSAAISTEISAVALARKRREMLTTTREEHALRRGVMAADGRTRVKPKGSPIFPQGCRSWREWVFLVFEDSERSLAGKLVSQIILLLIAVSTLSFLFATMRDYQITPAACTALLRVGSPLSIEACMPQPAPIFETLESITIIIFTVEYVCRALTLHAVPIEFAGFVKAKDEDAEEDEGHRITTTEYESMSAFQRTWHYVKRPMNLIDVVAILPYYVQVSPIVCFERRFVTLCCAFCPAVDVGQCRWWCCCPPYLEGSQGVPSSPDEQIQVVEYCNNANLPFLIVAQFVFVARESSCSRKCSSVHGLH